jgi:uncharacterized UPF0146 family protein
MRLKKTVVAVALALRGAAHQRVAAYMGRAGIVLHAVDLNDADTKAAIKKAVDDATAELATKNKKLLEGITSKSDIQQLVDDAVEEATTGLKTKNTELLGEVKKLRKAGGDVDPAVLDKAEKRIEELDGLLLAANKELKTTKGELGKVTKALEGESGFTQKLLIDNGLADALVKAGVSNATRLKASIAMLRGQVKVVAEGDVRKAMVGDKELSAFITEWAASAEGKEFVTAQANTGGGAQKTAGSSKVGDADFAKLPPVERMNAARAQAKAAAGGK